MKTPVHREPRLISKMLPGSPLVPARICREYSAGGMLDDVQSSWNREREALVSRLIEMGHQPLEHLDWDWLNNVDGVEADNSMLVGVECDGEVQGLMSVLRGAQFFRSPQQGMLYVDYLESAPWNLKTAVSEPRYVGVGTILIAEAVRLSLELGLEGRVGLHSLKQAERFYRDKCRMIDFGEDAESSGLTYFEFSSQRAAEFLVAIGDSE
jgi:hypothetical protein